MGEGREGRGKKTAVVVARIAFSELLYSVSSRVSNAEQPTLLLMSYAHGHGYKTCYFSILLALQSNWYFQKLTC